MYSELPEGHPIRTYLQEAELIQNLLEEIMQTSLLHRETLPEKRESALSFLGTKRLD